MKYFELAQHSPREGQEVLIRGAGAVGTKAVYKHNRFWIMNGTVQVPFGGAVSGWAPLESQEPASTPR